jgi:hypothetical protein
MTPELQAAVLATVPNGEFGLKKLLAELNHLQTKKPYPLPLPEYLTVGEYGICTGTELFQFFFKCDSKMYPVVY